MLNLLHVLNWDLAPGMLNSKNARVHPDSIGPRHVANGVKGVGEGLLQWHYVPDHECGIRGSGLG